MLLHHVTRVKLAAVAATILVIGIGVGALNYHLRRERLTAHLEDHALQAAIAFDASELALLKGSREDLTHPAYLTVKQRLQKLRAVEPTIRYVYLFRARAANERVIFLADSTAAGAKDESLPGDVYPEAKHSPGLQHAIRTGESGFEGPLRDSFGVWITAYARAGGPAALPPAGGAIELLGVDVSVADWESELWLAAAQGMGLAWMLLGFPVFAYFVARRQGEQRDAIRNLSEAVEQSHSAIMILDLEHRIEYVNRGLSQQIGYSRRELIGRDWREFLMGPGSGAVIADLMETIRSGRTWDGEWTNQRKDGGAYPIRGLVTPVRHRDGALACYVASFDDLTEAKRKEAELREARDLAQAGDRAKGQFLATMSHEVRTPLNGIVGFTSLLLDTPLSTEQREFVQTIRASGEALIQLTGDILDFARIESGKLKLDPIACDPRECIEEALDLHAGKAAEKGLELLYRVSDDVPAAVIIDGGRLRQVVVNLVGNAVKFTERGEVNVSLRLALVSPPPEGGARKGEALCRLEFSVRDTGIGIPADQHARLFKPFSQIDETSTRRYGGAGLGLAICKNLVTLMGGSIALTSVPGQGSTVTFTVTAPTAAPAPAKRQLHGLRVALALQSEPLRRDLLEVMRGWEADPFLTARESLNAREWDVALFDFSQAEAEELAARGSAERMPLPEKAIALVPISLGSDIRAALRSHFRLLINRPIHHEPLFAALSGSRPAAVNAPTAPTQFGLRALIVEDNEVNQRLLQKVLTGLGCTHKTAANGREAIEALTRHASDYDLALLDLHMPEMDGLAALERIRRGDAGPRAQAMWIIALTADVRPEQKERGLAAGLNDYLTKPLRMPDLEAALRRFRSERLARKN